MKETIQDNVYSHPEHSGLAEEKVKTLLKYIAAADPALRTISINIRENPGGGKVARFTTTLEAAARLAEISTIRVGWSRCRVKLMERKLPICYKSQKREHMAYSCNG